MSLMAQELDDVWVALRASATQWEHALQEVRIRSFRGIRELRVRFPYPVSVLAGPNGCGKSTVLFACAAGYRVPGANPRQFTPKGLFPHFTDGGSGELADSDELTALEFHYVHGGEHIEMAWRRGRNWNRSFFGQRGATQPEREVYLRTLANLTNPSEAQGVLRLARRPHWAERVTEDYLVFAHRILRQRYEKLSMIRAEGEARDLLFAEVEGGFRYSEFHMAAGERTILRLSKDLAYLKDALVLIDEVETGLHPYTQQQLMLELQRAALRQRLQIIVASHSPVVLDSVPPEARIFLDRDDGTADVRQLPAYRDIFQKALYGQSREQLSILCEDEVAEGALLGVLDYLQPRMELRHEDFIIGRDTGRDEFPAHMQMLAKFGKLNDFLLVLDGDSRHMEKKIKDLAGDYGKAVRPLFLPGELPPEHWIWESLRKNIDHYAPVLGLTAADMQERMKSIERMLEGAVRRRDPAKAKLEMFAHGMERKPADIARTVGRMEASDRPFALRELIEGLQEAINAWRELK